MLQLKSTFLLCFCSSYGSVWEATHRKTGNVVAMKRVPIENDYEDLLKEIQHMKQCESSHIVKYYGSYYFGSELWVNGIVWLSRTYFRGAVSCVLAVTVAFQRRCEV